MRAAFLPAFLLFLPESHVFDHLSHRHRRPSFEDLPGVLGKIRRCKLPCPLYAPGRLKVHFIKPGVFISCGKERLVKLLPVNLSFPGKKMPLVPEIIVADMGRHDLFPDVSDKFRDVFP